MKCPAAPELTITIVWMEVLWKHREMGTDKVLLAYEGNVVELTDSFFKRRFIGALDLDVTRKTAIQAQIIPETSVTLFDR